MSTGQRTLIPLTIINPALGTVIQSSIDDEPLGDSLLSGHMIGSVVPDGQ